MHNWLINNYVPKKLVDGSIITVLPEVVGVGIEDVELTVNMKLKKVVNWS